MNEQTLTLKGWGGQHADVEIHRRSDDIPWAGKVYVTFKYRAGYGYPSLELDRLKAVVEQAEQMERAR